MKRADEPPLRARILAKLAADKPHRVGPESGRCAKCGGEWPCLVTAMATDVLPRIPHLASAGKTVG